MRGLKTIFPLLLLSFFTVAKTYAQVFPVQATTQLARPYSLYLSDYTAPGSDRLTVNVFLSDPNRASLDIRLRLRIEGQGIKIETKPEFTPAPLTLHGGVPLQLISSDLAEYFEPRNLNFSGISQRDYEQRGALPEGLYQFCFEVLEYNRVVKISNTSCAFAWLILNDPPLINLPRDNEKIRIQSPQQVVFQWTPRHTGSPNAAFTTEYDFKLVEVWPATRNPNDAILTSRPIYETTTTSSTLIYGAAETALEPGRRYAFQVKARSVTGVTELNLFKNNGLSQVSSFIYGDACLPPTNILAAAASPSQFGVSWESGTSQTGYSVRYRLASSGAQSNWYVNNSVTTDATINSLQPATTYEYQVAATCGFLESVYSPIARVTTKSSPVAIYSCGLPPDKFDLDPSQLIDVLNVGDIIKAGDYDVTLTKVSGSGGRFTGEGNIEMSYFKNAKVNGEFTNIAVNKDKRMVSGVLNVTGAGVDVIPAGVMNVMDQLTETLNQVDSALADYESNLPKRFDENSFVAEKSIVLAGTASVFKESNGSVTVVDAAGNKQTIPAGTTAAVVDGSGKGYLVNKNGGIHTTTAAVAAKAGAREYNLTVTFEADEQQRYGFDAKEKKDALAPTYDKLNDSYDVAWKSVAVGATDPVQAIIGNNLDKSRIRFEQATKSITATPSGSNFTLNVQASSDGEVEGLLALYTPADATQKEQVLGQLNIATYSEIHKTLVVVPVNNNSLSSVGTKEQLEAQLNKIYGRAVVKWTVNFASDKLFVAGIEPFDDGGTGLLSNYTSHMKKVIDAYGALDDETYYLFLVNNPASGEVLGFMPRSKNAGFIFVDKTGGPEATARTMAHELGHGAFNLNHTFEEPNFTIPKNTTDNLMDYGGGTKLYKFQWDKMRYPDIVMGVFESDDQGRFVNDYFPRPLTIYFDNDPFLISMSRENASSIMLNIEYKGSESVKSSTTDFILSRQRKMEIFKTTYYVQSEYLEVVLNKIKYGLISNLRETKIDFLHSSQDTQENDVHYRTHEFAIFPSEYTSFVLTNPKTTRDETMVINGVKIGLDNSVMNALPDQISDVTLASTTVNLAAGIVLYSNDDCDKVVTNSATYMKFSITKDYCKIEYSPSLDVLIDYAPDAIWKSTSYNFKTRRLTHEIDAHSFSPLSSYVSSQVGSRLDDYFAVLLKNTIIGKQGYDPTKDKNIGFSLDQMKQNLKQDTRENPTKPCKDLGGYTGLELSKVQDPILTSTVVLAQDITHLDEAGTGVTIAKGTKITLRFQFQGTLQQISDVTQIKLQQMALETDNAIIVQIKNKPAVALKSISILHGGSVRVNETELLGDLAEIQAYERSFIDALKGLLAVAIYRKTGRILPVASDRSNSVVKTAVEIALDLKIRETLFEQIENSNTIFIEKLGSKLSESQKENVKLKSILGIDKLELVNK